ncbi:glycerate kinase [Spirosoma montaniterrae]|uniref:Glycerate kinase n=1 Tax=Spirosoma montaniterrae TaxID=1178516 RepID=A0A1P9WRG9_9BACT|nr:glycerate kinase [Spirosoma montaniterrae]AQG77961.1 glycerate kinase [Spirosoma montaniterrae]
MHILLAPDKFRGSLTAREVTNAMTEGIRLALPTATVTALPLADGGEGTAQVLTEATEGIWHTATVYDPLGRSVEAGFGISGDGTTAFIEMALASGLGLLKTEERNPLYTSTYGTGELIREAAKKGVQKIVLGIGGSATTDAGIGMAAALGWQFLDANGQLLEPTGANLLHIAQLIRPDTNIADGIRVAVACDVTNPLFGPEGAAYIYGPQKGADEQAVATLDAGLRRFARLVDEQYSIALAQIPGAGAAGGLGAGAFFFLNAALQPGVDLVLETVDFDLNLANADLVLTGEGKLDRQTTQGKLIQGIADRAKHANAPVIALCGTLDLAPEAIRQMGLKAAFSVLNQPQSLREAMQTAYDDVVRATFNVCRLFL